MRPCRKYMSPKTVRHSITIHKTAEIYLLVLAHVGWAVNAPTGLQLLLFYCFFSFLFAFNFSPPLCLSCLIVWSWVKWMKRVTGRVHPAHRHILGDGQRGSGRRRQCLKITLFLLILTYHMELVELCLWKVHIYNRTAIGTGEQD